MYSIQYSSLILIIELFQPYSPWQKTSFACRFLVVTLCLSLLQHTPLVESEIVISACQATINSALLTETHMHMKLYPAPHRDL